MEESRGYSKTGAEIVNGNYMGLTESLTTYREDPNAKNEITKTEKLGYHPKDDWILNEKLNPNAKPQNGDPIRQKKYTPPSEDARAPIQSYGGIGYTSVNPSDPSIDVGPNHVIQMINGGSGSYFTIFDKVGNEIIGQTYLDNFLGFPGGSGDPIVLYDQQADRWMMSEFANAGNYLHVAISQTADPTGSWHIYIYDTPSFPDYPKYGIWNDAYIVTTNENTNAIYALDRTKMLAGTANNAQRFTVPTFGTIGFQALTPIDIDGTINPAAGDNPLVMRMADDAWDSSLPNDLLEIWEFDIDFANQNNSSLTLQLQLATSPFDTELCGYTSFSCIDQPNSNTNLDPLRELLMNKAHYRNFGTHESIVCCSVTDVSGNDDAGIRWYELRRTGGGLWSIYQEGTYAPDNHSRWMPSIAINADGAIGLMYNISSSTIFPSIRYTGRKECDPLGTMTVVETEVATGAGANGSNRYGDYNCMVVDPIDGTFWLTAQYNPTTQWSTHIAQFGIESCVPSVKFNLEDAETNEEDIVVDDNCRDYHIYNVGVSLNLAPTAPADITVNVNSGSTAAEGIDFEISNNVFTLNSNTLSHDVDLKIYDDGFLEGNETIVLDLVMNSNGGDAVLGITNQIFTLTIGEAEVAPNASVNIVTEEDFEVDLGAFTTINLSGDTPFQQGSTTAASSSAFTVPTGTNVAYINDDDCDCDQNDVQLITPSYDLSTCQNAMLDFDLYYEGKTYQNNTEEGKLQVSINGGAWTDVQTFTGVEDQWQNISVDLTPYLGNADVKFAFHYSDGTGWLYGMVVDNVKFTCASTLNIQTAVNSSTPTEQYFGPNSTVHFYDDATGNIMLTLTNNTSFDYGCTTVEVDRQGTTPTTHPFTSNNPLEYLMSKTFKIIPTNDDPTGSYDISMYYELEEVTAWETETGESRTAAEIIKVSGANQIQDVTPSNFSTFIIESETPTINSFGSDIIFSATFNSGFSGFGIGLPVTSTGVPDSDSDNDGVGDLVDNCPDIPNAGQENSDGDNYGAACDCNDNNPNDEDLAVNENPIAADTYEANVSLNSAGTILTQTSFTAFYAGETIYLNPGFVAESGSDFLAKIQDCEGVPSSFQIPTEENVFIENEDIDKNQNIDFLNNPSNINSIELAIIPNPLENKTTIYYNVPQAEEVNLSIIDTRGIVHQQIIKNSIHDAGQFEKPIDASNLSNGVYIVLLKVGNSIVSKRMIIIK